MKYIYGIVWKDTSVKDGLVGLHDWPVHKIDCKDIAALASDFFNKTIHGDETLVLCHNLVIQDYFEQATVLPFRFGTILEDEERVRQMMRDEYVPYKKNLRFVESGVEFGLKAMWNGHGKSFPPTGQKVAPDLGELLTLSVGPGATYLMKRYDQTIETREYEKGAKKVFLSIDRELSKLSRAKTIRCLTSPTAIMDAAYLVDKKDALEFQKKTRDFVSDIKILLTGPWAPYSFVGELRN